MKSQTSQTTSRGEPLPVCLLIVYHLLYSVCDDAYSWCIIQLFSVTPSRSDSTCTEVIMVTDYLQQLSKCIHTAAHTPYYNTTINTPPSPTQPTHTHTHTLQCVCKKGIKAPTVICFSSSTRWVEINEIWCNSYPVWVQTEGEEVIPASSWVSQSG